MFQKNKVIKESNITYPAKHIPQVDKEYITLPASHIFFQLILCFIPAIALVTATFQMKKKSNNHLFLCVNVSSKIKTSVL